MVSIAHWSVSGITKLYGSFVLLLVVVLLALPCEANDAVRDAAKTALTNVTARSLGKLYKVREQTDTPECREMVIKACVAGLYVIGDTKNATKVARELDCDEFLLSFTSECGGCNGEGTTQTSCLKCKGTGGCQNRKCDGGMVTSAGFDGRSSTRKCSTCGGSGQCTNCKGSGNVMKVCSRCSGSKRIINKKSAKASCQEQLKMLVAENNRERVKESGNGKPAQVGELANNEKREKESENQMAKIEVDSKEKLETKNADEQRIVEEERRKAEEEKRKAEENSPSEIIRRRCANNASAASKLFQDYEFNFEEYLRWKDRNTTSIQKNRIFENLVQKGFNSSLYKDYVRVGLALVPDGLSFVVSDVKEISFRTSDVEAYSVELELLSCDSDGNRDVESWQNKDLLRNLREQRLFPWRVSLLIPECAGDVSNWQKGKIIVSKGWIYDVEIIDAIVTYNNGSRGIDRRIGLGYSIYDKEFVFRSMVERMTFERNRLESDL